MGLFLGIGNTKPEFAYDYYYGIEWDITVSNPIPKRIGRLDLHQTLPLQSKIRRCILKDDGTVNYYLHANDSTLRDTGAAADLTGADGQYMVELPAVYVRFEQDGNKCRCLMSEYALPGFHLWRKDYISAVEATVQRSTLKLSSVVNMTEDYRGGNNQADWDGLSKSQLGKPATNLSLKEFREYARNRGTSEWNCQLYQTYKKLWWLFAVEYCNFNSQENFKAELTADGLHQGGLGLCVASINNTDWLNFNEKYPIIPCGVTNSLGNSTGRVEYGFPSDYKPDMQTGVSVPSYRGVENPFGNIYKITDGCKVIFSGVSGYFYVCDNPDNFSDAKSDENYVLRGNAIKGTSYIKQLIIGDDGEILPIKLGASNVSYFCDYYSCIPFVTNKAHCLNFGGDGDDRYYPGFVCCSVLVYDSKNTSYGSRLCFYPKSQ